MHIELGFYVLTFIRIHFMIILVGDNRTNFDSIRLSKRRQ